MKKVVKAESYDPHAVLGLHSNDEHSRVIKLWRPGASQVFLEVFGNIVEAKKCHKHGMYEYEVPAHTTFKDYRIYDSHGNLVYDPYAFTSTFGELDGYLFCKGTHYELYNVMGARLFTHQGIPGVKFAVWAPNAKRVSVVGDFNYWNGSCHQMRSTGFCGVWELFVPGLKEGDKYKFEIKTQSGEIRLKADPYAFSSELRPATASVVSNLDRFQWTDQHWIQKKRDNKFKPQPISIYEVHLGSWRKNHGGFPNYRDLAIELAKYCKEMHFTHIELLPIQEHPLDESWGYQVSGYYAVTSRYGSPEDFQWFVNHMHNEGIGVILDWVPGHFPTDDFSLARFDGSYLFEHSDPKQGFHPHWSTLIFNYGRKEVSNFLIANALFWLEKMHLDGLRVDAVASMLYLDYGRSHGEWIPNKYGGNENLDAIEFLKHLNSIVQQRSPGSWMIAEESTSFYKVSHPVEEGGLGFTFKWNMGWMNDTLHYFTRDPLFRHYHHNNLTWGFFYAFSEKFVLVLSHDEVVHGKKSLISKMPGDAWQQFANLRLLYTYMMCQPGKKLIFMGGEIGQWNEWACSKEIEWGLLNYIPHQGIQRLVKEINEFYLHNPILWENDFHHTGAEWVDFSDTKNCTISYLRKSGSGQLLCIHNFTPNYIDEYLISMPNLKYAEEIFNSDAEKYGGSGKINQHVDVRHPGHSHALLKIRLAPLATMIFKVHFT